MTHPIFGFDAPADAERWVYHYTSLPTAVAIATSGTFRFNPLSEMNDPREFKRLTLPVMSNGRPLTRRQLATTEQLVNRRRLAVRVGAFTRDDAAGRGSSLVRTDARGYARPMMWTHYARNHRGVCFVFDRAAFERALHAKFGADLLTGDISYLTLSAPPAWTPVLDASGVRSHGEAKAADRFFNVYRRDLLFTKNQDWSVEREWRVAIDNQPTGPIDVRLSPGIVAGLVLGLSLPRASLTAVQTVASAFGISDHVARAYQHQVNVIDVVPHNTSGTRWRDYTRTELHRASATYDLNSRAHGSRATRVAVLRVRVACPLPRAGRASSPRDPRRRHVNVSRTSPPGLPRHCAPLSPAARP